jgi:hypothetical protein
MNTCIITPLDPDIVEDGLKIRRIGIPLITVTGVVIRKVANVEAPFIVLNDDILQNSCREHSDVPDRA